MRSARTLGALGLLALLGLLLIGAAIALAPGSPTSKCPVRLADDAGPISCEAPTAPSSGFCLLPPGVSQGDCTDGCPYAPQAPSCWISTPNLNPLAWATYVLQLMAYALCLVFDLLAQLFIDLIAGAFDVLVWIVSAPASIFSLLATGVLGIDAQLAAMIAGLGVGAVVAGVLAGSLMLAIGLVVVYIGIAGVRNAVDLL